MTGFSAARAQRPRTAPEKAPPPVLRYPDDGSVFADLNLKTPERRLTWRLMMGDGGLWALERQFRLDAINYPRPPGWKREDRGGYIVGGPDDPAMRAADLAAE